MEWTASASIAATSHALAPKPPNNPTNDSEKEDGDVPMRETNEGTKKKEQPNTIRGSITTLRTGKSQYPEVTSWFDDKKWLRFTFI